MWNIGAPKQKREADARAKAQWEAAEAAARAKAQREATARAKAQREAAARAKAQQLPVVPQWCAKGATVVVRRNGRVASIVAVKPDYIVVRYNETGTEGDCLLSGIALAPPLLPPPPLLAPTAPAAPLQLAVATAPHVPKLGGSNHLFAGEWKAVKARLLRSKNAPTLAIAQEMVGMETQLSINDLQMFGVRGRRLAEAFAGSDDPFLQGTKSLKLSPAIKHASEKKLVGAATLKDLRRLRDGGNSGAHTQNAKKQPVVQTDVPILVNAALGIARVVDAQPPAKRCVKAATMPKKPRGGGGGGGPQRRRMPAKAGATKECRLDRRCKAHLTAQCPFEHTWS